MASYSHSSNAKLITCDRRLQRVFFDLIHDHDNTIIEGHRSPARQKRLFLSGASKVEFGKHNAEPSLAVDSGPFIPGRGIPWPKHKSDTYIKDLAQFYYYAGWVMDRAKQKGIILRWGGDWDRDHDLADQTFDDLVHYELI